jgi:hypothetical protein
MSAIAEDEGKKRRRSRLVAGQVGVRLVMDELLRRGFDAQLAGRHTKEYDVLLGLYGSPRKPVHVRTVHVGPWYVRSSHFAAAVADQVTVYVLLGLRKNPNCARFFVTKNCNVESGLRQPPNWRDFGFIDVEVVEQFEDNWDLLKT